MGWSPRIVAASLLSSVMIWTLAPAGRTADWEPLEPAQLALARPLIDPEADIEALSWDIWVDEAQQGNEPQTRYRHRVRLKVFNQRGVDSLKQVEIPFGNDVFVREIEARTVRPDGTIVELQGKDVFERTLVKASGLKLKAKSFAIPGLVPGAIVDYRWSETHIKQFAHDVILDLQREEPVHRVRHHVRPSALAEGVGYRMSARWFNQEQPKKEDGPFGYTVFTYAGLPAFKEEPFMPPEYTLRRWMLVYYTENPDMQPQKFWRKRSGKMHGAFKPRKPSRAVVAALAAAGGAAGSPAETARRLDAFCRARIKRTDLDSSGLTPDEKKTLLENRDSTDTLEHGYGTGDDVLRLFIDLAGAAGLDARIADLPDGAFHFFVAGFPSDYFLRALSVAVRDGDGWFFCDPAASYLPPGMLRWQEEGQLALIADPEQLLLVPTLISAPDKSLAKREARLRISEDGTVEGDVSEEFTGHLASGFKHDNDDKSPQERIEALEEEIKKRLSTAELSAIAFENVQDPEKPFIRRYHVRVPNYAQKTGRRIFFQPSFFEKGGQAAFPASKRRHPIWFPFAWSEQDHVVVDVPPGFSFEEPSLPAALSGGAVASCVAKARIIADKTLDYERAFRFGGEGQLYFEVASYPILKEFFDAAYETENHTLTLRQDAPGQPATP